MRLYGSRPMTLRSGITCFRCGEQGHYKVECLSWRTKLCCHHARPTGCRDGVDCSYAHCVNEIRAPWNPRCVRVVKRAGRIITLGCGSQHHTFKSCPDVVCGACNSHAHWLCDCDAPL